MILPIVTVPHKVLSQKARSVKDFGPKLKKLTEDMIETLESCVDPIGVGLAAPQVGVGQRIFIVKPTPKSKCQVFVNPEILSIDSEHKEDDPKSVDIDNAEALEGCLSIPRIWSPVTRPQKVVMAWQDTKGKNHQKEFTGFEAVIMQHEVDHLDGILFTRRATEQKSPLYEEKGKKLYEMKI
jgi:peptide deformylase